MHAACLRVGVLTVPRVIIKHGAQLQNKTYGLLQLISFNSRFRSFHEPFYSIQFGSINLRHTGSYSLIVTF